MAKVPKGVPDDDDMMTPATRRTIQELKTMTLYTTTGIGSMLALSMLAAWLDGVI